MKSKIIKSKKVSDGIVEIIEHKDDFGKIVNYSVIKAIHGINVIGNGAGSLEESNFIDKQESIKFFNNQK